MRGENYIAGFPDFRLNANPDMLKGWSEIFKSRQHITVPPKAVVSTQGEIPKTLYYIESGLMEYTYTDTNGDQNLIEVLGDYCLFPLQPIFGNNPMVGTFQALEICTLSLISVEEVHQLIRDDSSLAIELLAEFGRISGGHIRHLGMNMMQTTDRVMEIFFHLAEYKMRHACEGNIPLIQLSQNDLARITRTTRVTVTKVISELKKEGIIETAYGGFTIMDFPKFKKLMNE